MEELPEAKKRRAEPVSQFRPLVRCELPERLTEQSSRLDLHARAHRGGNRHALDVSALRAGGLRLGNRVGERLDVLHQLLFREGRLADAGLEDSSLFDAEL